MNEQRGTWRERFDDWLEEPIAVPRSIAIVGGLLFFKALIDTIFWVLSWLLT